MTNTKKPIWPPPKPIHKVIGRDDRGYQVAGITAIQFNDWYAQHIESLGPAIEVGGQFDGSLFDLGEIDAPSNTHSALLIGIRPIKEETADDLFTELVSEFGSDHNDDARTLIAKVREYLARKEADGK